MASLFFRRAKGSVSAWLLSLPFGKLNAGSAQSVFTTDTQDIVLLVNCVSDAGRRAVHRVLLYNDIHKLITHSGMHRSGMIRP